MACCMSASTLISSIRNWRLVRVATTKAQRKLFFNLRRMKKNLAWLSDSETAAVAGELGVDAREVREMERRLSARDLSFDPAPDAGDEESIASPSLYLPSPEADPATISFTPRPDWYFYFLFYLLRIFKWPDSVILGTVGIPTILIILMLAVRPTGILGYETPVKV